MFSEPAVLRVTAAVAAATAAVGAAVMRRWDVEAGKRVADLTRARASDEWRHEEKVAELETDLDESRELRTKLEHKLRAKRTELANLRNEHAALLRRYATAETERASALEGRRLLEIEATVPEDARALPASGADAGNGDAEGDGDKTTAVSRTSTVPPQGVPSPGAPWASWETASKAAAARVAEQGTTGEAGAGGGAGSGAEADAEAEKSVPSVFSPAGSSLFLRANSALDRIITQRGSVPSEKAGAVGEADDEGDAEPVAAEAVEESASEDFEPEGSEFEGTESEGAEPAGEGADESLGGSADQQVDESVDESADGSADESVDESVETPVDGPTSSESTEHTQSAESAESAEFADVTAKGEEAKGGSPKGPSPKGDPDGPTDGGTRQGRSAEAEEEPVPVLTAEEGDAVGRSVADRGHERAAGGPVPVVTAPVRSTDVGELTRVEPAGRAGQGQQTEPVAPAPLAALPPAGHFTVPTAVAVVPAAPQRRTAVEGGFDFFGTQKAADALEAVQNEDLADVVGQEALALHKAESESQFKRVDEASRGIGQVIDLTAHDETEQIDVQGLRTAAS
ncbi:hypothetical protein RM704_16120 [Streptomyces sp. DSM 3412]|uniref:Secreted protein n=1 Tax=Streptomyces gottesmaniae TaxID=3075518 RepID=A0ABU2YZX2_9ACTN|nr:hypothetical protein [Streptomyces sp. DSM 3412]MDT0568979.1 hypothetical protein [Streptomyces sp. DSM 3412]